MNRPLIVSLALVASLHGSWAAADALDAIRSRGVVRVGVKIDYPPFGYVGNGAIVGVEPDLAVDVADALQVGLDLVPVTAGNRFDLLLNGEVDVLIATVSDTNERRQMVRMVDPDYYASGTSAMATQVAGLRGWGDLEGRLVCAVEGAFYNASVRDQFGAELLLYPGTTQMMEGLRGGLCVAAVYDAAFFISELLYGDWAEYEMPLETINTEYWGVAVAPGEEALALLMSGLVTRWHMTGRIIELLVAYDVPENPLAEELHDYLQALNPNIAR